jgi:hypothetical protein
MKKFIKNILLFSGLILSVYIILFISFYFIDNHLPCSLEYKNKTFIFGNSHTMSSVDPEVLEKHTGDQYISYAANGQSLFWATQGIEKKITQCKNSQFIIEFTNNSLTTDWWTYDNSRMLREKDKLYQVNLDEWSYLFNHNPLKSSKMLLTLPLPSGKIEGKFGKNEKSRLEEDIMQKGERIIVQYRDMEAKDDMNEGYKNLAGLLQKYPYIKFIIIRSPMHHTYFEMLSEINNESQYQELLFDLKKFPNCRIYDFGHLELNDSCFADMDHLNYKGSSSFSQILADTLLKGTVK